MDKKIFGRWDSLAGMKEDFALCQSKYNEETDEYEQDLLDLENFPTEENLLFASYGGGCYEGDALVIFEHEGTLYEVHGSHCSCNGLEGQWEPGVVTWPALRLRVDAEAAERAQAMKEERDVYSWDEVLHEHDADAQEAFRALVLSKT